MTRRTTTPFTLAALAAAALACASPAHAFTCTWTGAASGLANNPANWNCGGSPNPLPVNGDDLVFPDNAPNAANYTHNLSPNPVFGNLTFGKGYTANGSYSPRFAGSAEITGPFTMPLASLMGQGGATLLIRPSAVTDVVTMGGINGIATIDVGTGSGSAEAAHAVIGSNTQGTPAVTIHNDGRLSGAFTASTLTVEGGGVLVVSEPTPFAVPGSSIGTIDVNQQPPTYQNGAVVEYRAYPVGSYNPGVITLNTMALGNATLRVVVPNQAAPVGTVYTIGSFGNDSALQSTFAGLPNGTVFAAANAPNVYFRINYLLNDVDDIILTRVASLAPEGVPPVMNAIPNATIPVGTAWSLDLNQYVTATDSDPIIGSTVTGGLPPGLVKNPDGTVSGSPTTPGTYTVAARMSDKDGDSNAVNFTITVTAQGGGNPGGPGGPGGNVAAVPALGPAGLSLMSLLVAGVGALRRRKHGA